MTMLCNEQNLTGDPLRVPQNFTYNVYIAYGRVKLQQ